MSHEVIYCEDIPGGECCDSCHSEAHEEGYGTNDLWIDSWLHLCCSKMGVLIESGINRMSEQVVRDWIAAQAS